jgi:hypothetical protein
MEEAFNKWIFEVCLYIQNKSIRKVELEGIFSSIDLTDTKLAFIDGESPESYKPFNKY